MDPGFIAQATEVRQLLIVFLLRFSKEGSKEGEAETQHTGRPPHVDTVKQFR